MSQSVMAVPNRLEISDAVKQTAAGSLAQLVRTLNRALY